jgi:V/A-type H+-transporting ATPase subunit D
VARRGAELLDSKQRALAAEQRRLAPLAAAAQREWEDAARAAERSLARAAVMGGERQVEIARRTGAPGADLTVRWQTVLGVTVPVDAELGAFPDLPPTGASAALLAAAEAHRAALGAGVRAAALAGALARVEDDLRSTALRRNAVEHRWIPAHEAALRRLELTLEELEREDGTRVRWAASR